MSLYGALSSGVSGLKGQANAIGVLSDNISNVNTVGFKASAGIFETLVTNSGTVAYSPGGVLGKSRATISSQGLLTTTNNSTDVAISGKGFFVVNTLADASGTVNYTRAGSFRQDSTGNFQNAAGYFLQGWPLDRDGRLPGESGNANTTSSTSLTSLETVNVSALTGSAASTSSITLSANLQSSESAYQGAGATVDMDAFSSSNYQITSSQIIIPTTTNDLARGDKFLVTSGSGLSYTFQYGGFTFTSDVTNGAAGDDGLGQPNSPLTLGNNPFTTSATLGDNTVTVRHSNHGLQTGDTVTISGVLAAVDGIPAGDFNNSFIVTVLTEDTYTIEVATGADGSSGTGGGTTASAVVRPFTGNIFDASTTTSAFFGTTGTSGFETAALTFTITTASTGIKTFTYVSGTPNAQLGQFNTMANLATAISAVDGLTARIVNNRLYVSAIDANEAITFANGDDTGSGLLTALKRGIDWVGELGFKNVAAGSARFSTMEGLAAVVNASDGISATVNNPDSVATVDIYVDDPLDTITFSDRPVDTGTTTFTSQSVATASGSSTLTLTHNAAHGFSTGDVISLNPAGITNYPAASSAVAANFSTTNTSTTVTITDTTHGFTTGDNIFFNFANATGYPNGTIGGIPIYEFEGLHVVTVTGANTYTITTDSAATSTSAVAGPGGTFTASPTIGGIPITDLNASFEVTVSNSTAYTIRVQHAATSAVTTTTGASGLIVSDPTNGGSVVAELGLVASLNGTAFSTAGAQTTGALGPAYAASDPDTNMAGGNITPQYFTNIRIFDSLGTGHDLRAAFIKTGTNTWAAEVFAVPDSDVSASFPDGLLASGTITFNGDGTLRSVSAGLSADISISWSNGAEASTIEFNWGTSGPPASSDPPVAGAADGLSQFDTNYKLNFANQNGVPVGELIGVEIDEAGIVTARFNNGEEQALFKIPLADFANPDGLDAVTGNVFAETTDSGTVNLREAGTSGTGDIQSSALESSNAELSEQLTTMIIVQRAYQANTRTITTADELLEELNNILR